jgi:hypothetical protein
MQKVKLKKEVRKRGIKKAMFIFKGKNHYILDGCEKRKKSLYAVEQIKRGCDLLLD